MSKRPYSTKLNKLGIDARTDLSKQEEIGIIETLHDAFKGTGNYLESLFSKNIVDWVSEEIRQDFLPNVMSAWSLDQIRMNVLENEIAASKNNEDRLKHQISVSHELHEHNKELQIQLNDTRIRAEKAEEILAQLKLVLDLINNL